MTIPRNRLTSSTVCGCGIFKIASIFEEDFNTLLCSIVWPKNSILFTKNKHFDRFKCKSNFCNCLRQHCKLFVHSSNVLPCIIISSKYDSVLGTSRNIWSRCVDMV